MKPLTLKAAGLLGLVLAMAHAGAQPAPDAYAEQVRKAPAVGVAITFLEHERERISIDLVRTHGNVRLMLGGQAVTGQNVESVASDNERKLAILADEMKRRGFAQVAGDYAIQTYAGPANEQPPACGAPGAPGASWGLLTIVQDGSSIEFRERAGRLSGHGVIVDSSIAVVPGAPDRVSPLAIVGVVQGGAIVLSLYDKSPAALHPGAGPAICRIGTATRSETVGG